MMNVTTYQVDALRELINIGVGRAAGMLNEMLQSPIQLQIPVIKILEPEELRQELKVFGSDCFSIVSLRFRGDISGTAGLLFPLSNATKLVSMMTGEPMDEELDELRVGTLSEVGNILLNAIMGSISNIMKQSFSYELPSYSEQSVEQIMTTHLNDRNAVVLLAVARFMIENAEIEGDIMIIFEVDSLNELLQLVENL